ncbi:MAG: exodeoxyribonuclease VII large subunit [Betaproteobacteria bacterium]
MDIDADPLNLSKNDRALKATAPVIPVSLLVGRARLLIERHLGLAWVSGEVSGLSRAASGHCYFTLKDDRAQVRCVLFRHKAALQSVTLKDGMAVEVRALPTIYEARGDFQLSVEAVRLAGVGALYERFEKLKARLDAAGWFRQERKRPMPAFPRAVGIVSSPHAAALADVLATLERRFAALPVFLYCTAVQGAGAAAEIAAAIALANERAEVDVLIVCRGGGSIEDLWAFNEEAVARAVFESVLPIVSGVGHETDFTICDFVADIRAATPTAAAALAVPDRSALAALIAALRQRWRRAAALALEPRMQRVDLVSRRLQHPAARLEAQGSALRALARRLAHAGRSAVRLREREGAECGRRLLQQLRAPLPAGAELVRIGDRWRRGGATYLGAHAQALGALAAGLRLLGPQGVLDRGYSIVATADGTIVQSSTQVEEADALELVFARGGARARVTSKREA